MNKEQTVQKYLKALQDLQLAIKYNPKLSMTQFMHDYNLSKNAGHALTTGKIIVNKGARGKGRFYVWNTINPNIKMAEEWVNRMQQNCNKSRNYKSKCFNDKDFENLKTVEESIIDLRKQGYPYREISNRLNVSKATISKVCNKKIKNNDSITKNNTPSKRGRPIGSKNKPKINVVQSNKEVSILWGLIKIKH